MSYLLHQVRFEPIIPLYSQSLLSSPLLTHCNKSLYRNIRTNSNQKSFEVDFTKGKDVDWLICPGATHRKLTSEYLEYGSLYIFRNSWLALKQSDIAKVKIKAIMKFTKFRKEQGALIGISVRKAHFFANFGYTLFINTDENIVRTVPEEDFGKYHDEIIAKHPNFNLDNFFEFYFELNNNSFIMSIDNIGKEFKISEMPFVFPYGKILFQTLMLLQE